MVGEMDGWMDGWMGQTRWIEHLLRQGGPPPTPGYLSQVHTPGDIAREQLTIQPRLRSPTNKPT